MNPASIQMDLGLVGATMALELTNGTLAFQVFASVGPSLHETPVATCAPGSSISKGAFPYRAQQQPQFWRALPGSLTSDLLTNTGYLLWTERKAAPLHVP